MHNLPTPGTPHDKKASKNTRNRFSTRKHKFFKILQNAFFEVFYIQTRTSAYVTRQTRYLAVGPPEREDVASVELQVCLLLVGDAPLPRHGDPPPQQQPFLPQPRQAGKRGFELKPIFANAQLHIRQICERTIKTSAPRPADDQTPSVKNNLPDFNAEAHSTGQLDQTQGSAWLARYNWHGSPGTRAKPECPKGDPDLVSDPPAPASAVSRPRSSGSGPSAAANSARAATTTSPSSADPHARHKRPGRVAAGWCSALVPQIKEQGCSSKHDKTGYWA